MDALTILIIAGIGVVLFLVFFPVIFKQLKDTKNLSNDVEHYEQKTEYYSKKIEDMKRRNEMQKAAYERAKQKKR